MKLVSKMLEPSREDAVRITRTEKMGMIVLAYAATILDELRTEMAKRIAMIPDGQKRMDEISEKTDGILHELRLTVPEEQRMNLQNTAHEYEVRLTPKATPSKTCVVMGKEEFRTLVDAARAKCVECTMDDNECEACELYKLLTAVLPLDDYHNGMLCPYNCGEWGN